MINAFTRIVTTGLCIVAGYICLQTLYVKYKLKSIHFQFDSLSSQTPQKCIVFVSDPQACYWCLKQAELWNEQTQKFIDNKGYTLLKLNVSDGILLARKLKLNHFSGFPVTLFFDINSVEAQRIYGVFNMKKLIKTVNQIK
ncbi:hypothetical protein SS50377_23635 [Spironucleus salmonicida]|uniref:Thioredoxin domain-containing protein n=1 Tax=Spironucleus salmonicida TaxID=348837 RepID=V6LVE1_9EUKA|nr:hypothetical protein SS50377_23635 [Spironucleus salmonicida]|eukprot:EST48617.1 Hypothetical protein SS50377_11229 [Spironucleus salmonicida]